MNLSIGKEAGGTHRGAKPKRYRMGTRKSCLALWQARYVQQRLAETGVRVDLVAFDTRGDIDLVTPLTAFDHAAPFTDDIERTLIAGHIDLAVHSFKDMATTILPGTTIAAVPTRGDPRDALVARSGASWQALPRQAVVGTCSMRRTAQLRQLRPDLIIKPLRGAVPDRVAQVLNGSFDAAVLAVAGLERLGMEGYISAYFDLDEMIPAPAQAALAVQVRSRDFELSKLVGHIDDVSARRGVELERHVLAMWQSIAPASAVFAKQVEQDIFQLRLRVLDRADRLILERCIVGGFESILRQVEPSAELLSNHKKRFAV